MATPDGRWRVEVVRPRGQRDTHYRILRDGEVFRPWAALGTVEYYLGQAGVDMADLVEVDPAA